MCHDADEGETIAALDKACCKMKKGEVAELRAHADMAWGSEGHTFSGGARVEGGQEVVLEVEMVEFEKQKGSWEMEDAEKVEFAESRKANGNGWFKKGHFERAIARYKKAADAIEFDSGFPDDLKKKAREVAVACLTNQAACFMKMGNHAEALKTAGKALKKDPASTKALFRRAQAHAGNKDYDMAERDLKEAMLREPENKDLATELKRVRAAAKQADQKQKAMWAKAFA